MRRLEALEASGFQKLIPRCNFHKKYKLYEAFLRVPLILYAFLHATIGGTGEEPSVTGVGDQHRPTIKTARTPTDEICLGNNQ